MSILLTYEFVHTRGPQSGVTFKLKKRSAKSRHSTPPNFIAEFTPGSGQKPVCVFVIEPADFPHTDIFPPRSIELELPMTFKDWFRRYERVEYRDVPGQPGLATAPGPSANDFYNNATPELVWDASRGVYRRTYTYQGQRVGGRRDRRMMNSWYGDYGVDPRTNQDMAWDDIWDPRTGRWYPQPTGSQPYGTAHDYANYKGYQHPNGYAYSDPSWQSGNVYMPASNHATRGSDSLIRKFVEFFKGPTGAQAYYPDNSDRARFAYTTM